MNLTSALLSSCAILLFCSTLGLAGELRFCYNGPQRIRYDDCPGGFISNRILNATCLYYYKPDHVPNLAALFTDNICEGTRLQELDREVHEFTEFDFQSIQFTDIDTVEPPTTGADPGIDKCTDDCLAEYVDPKLYNPVRVFVDKLPLDTNQTVEYRKEYTERMKTILLRIINEEEVEVASEEFLKLDPPIEPQKKLDIFGDSVRNTPMSSLMKLLAKSMKITYKRCEPYVELGFYTQVFRTMQEFRKLGDNYPNMNVISLQRILDILDVCEKEVNDVFQLNGTQCEDKLVVQTRTNLETKEVINYKMSPTSFRWGRYDPIVEAAWNAIDFIHGYCFEHFETDILHHSLYTKAMIDIFIQPEIQKHWMYPFPVSKSMFLWEIGYDTPDIQNQLRNLDACVDGAYFNSIFEHRLERPFTTEDMLVDMKYEDDPNIPPRGWTEGIEEYWRMYHQKGFRHMVEEFGYCLKTPEEFAEKETAVKSLMKCSK